MAGRKPRYGERTVPMRIPESLVPTVQRLLEEREVLEAQWDASKLPPVAEKLVQRMAQMVHRLMYMPFEAMKERAALEFQQKGGLSPEQQKQLRHLDTMADEFASYAITVSRAMLLEAMAEEVSDDNG